MTPPKPSQTPGPSHLPPDHSERLRILTELNTTLLVEAAAGTGKTTSIVGRMVGLIREGVCPVETMAAVTFTRKAAAELRSRFYVELQKAAKLASGAEQQRLLDAIDQVDRCFIGTIHSFCARLLRERPIEAGVAVDFREIEPDEDLRLREQAWNTYVAQLFVETNDILDELHKVGLDVGQLQQAFNRYAEYPDVEEWPVDDIDLGDLTPVLQSLNTYLSHLRNLARDFPKNPGSDKLMPAIRKVLRTARHKDLQRPAELFDLLVCFKSNIVITQKCWPQGKEVALKEQERWQRFADTTAEPLVEKWLAKRYAVIMRLLAGAAKVYDELRAALGRLNYQDLLLKAAELLRDKPMIREYFRRRFSHLLVDEFQDTDPIQAQVMLYLTASDPREQNWKKCRPVPGSLFVVGDPKQSIYRFRRADIVTYNQVKEIINERGDAVISLTANFRTEGPIVEWINGVFSQHFPTVANTYSPARCDMLVGRSSSTKGRLTGIHVLPIPEDCEKGDVALEYEATQITRYIRQALDSGWTVSRTAKELSHGATARVGPEDFLIVTWKKDNLSLYARKLRELGVPHQVTGGGTLGDSQELHLLLTCLQAVLEPDNPVSLVALLRSELFGFSDVALYAYRRAGGRFSFVQPLPEELEKDIAARFQDAFERLKRYAKWLRQLPPVSALERMTADLGLWVWACGSDGGEVNAGSLAKMFQLLRGMQSEIGSLADLAARFEKLLYQDGEIDSMPIRPFTTGCVRIINLHKVKGLEAPIVFLADPTGEKSHRPVLHVNRSGDRICGYFTVEHKKNVLAQPLGWSDLESEEDNFGICEKTRLMYVAATRVGSQLIVTQKQKRNDLNRWRFFSDDLRHVKKLASVPPQAAPASATLRLADADIAAAQAGIASNWQAVTQATYATAAAKEIALTSSTLLGRSHRHLSTGERGAGWGTVLHLLLETAMTQPTADLLALARSALEDQELPSSLAEPAVNAVQSVMESEIWKRALASEERLVEIPFARQLPRDADAEVPTIVRGVIDLAFREASGWTIVDYKSDVRGPEDLPALADHYAGQLRSYAQAWEAITGQSVRETGLYFTHYRQYVEI